MYSPGGQGSATPRQTCSRVENALHFLQLLLGADAPASRSLLRGIGIPAGFCYQHITLADDDSLGYCVHCYNAVYLDGRWIFLDARGNTGGRRALFSLEKPVLAYRNRSDYDEYFWRGIYASPQMGVMRMLAAATTRQDIIDNLQDYIEGEPDILDW